ncbi:Retrovirus-related Pol polyprotein from transposon opus [Colletotrichum higginsianum]|uniref:Retrovirus-related Pol polyprotein from transposon opus n=2 Tax=Colletotrichum higginsianum TaxID=80884 RepID=A0A4T0W4A6_9PEZI|nr:Retrovirus-related Pol polyprotein from transposon opus [Colletotrichum higginsianum]
MAPVTTPTPSSSASKGKTVTPPQPKSLDEEMKNAESSSDEDDNAELTRQLKRANKDIAKMQTMFNENAAAMEELQKQARRALALEDEVRILRAAGNIITTPMDGRDKLKLNSPGTFDGTPGQLKGFLIQIRTYQEFHQSNFRNETERIIHASTFLRGRALSWFEPYMEDLLDNTTLEHCKNETQDIFGSFQGFEHALKSLFQDPDEKRQAERDLSNLRQTKSATHYAAEFRRICARLDYTDDTRIFMFYQGLKEEVKDELAKIDRPDDFLQYVEKAIQIDTRLYERRREKGENRRPQANTSKRYTPGPRQQNNYNSNWRNNQQRNSGPSTAYGYHAGPMDVSVAHKNKPTTRRDPRSGVCFNCEKPGHIARDCRQPKRLQNRPLPEDTKKANIAKKEVPHEQLSWTACYSDECPTHQDGKEQAGWYPKEPKNKTVAVSRKSKNGDIQTMEKRNQQLITKLIQARDATQAQLGSPNMPETLQAIKARLQQRIQAQGDYQKQLALEEDLASSVQEEGEDPQETIEVLGERTSSEYTSDSGESLDEFFPPSKMERRAAEQLLELRRTRSSTRSKSPNLKIKQEIRQRLRNLDPYDRIKLQEYEIDEGNDIDSDEPLASQTYPSTGHAPLNQRPNVDKTHNNQERYVAYVKRIEPMKDERFESFINDQREEERLSPIPAEYRSYKKLFAEELETGLPEHGPWDHEIPIKEGEHPKFHKLYGLNENQREELDKYIDENLRKGYIRPSTSPAGYPILFVPKKNGKLRLCVDYRQLNDITIKNSYPLPLITELRDLLYGAKWFTALDLKGAYNLIRIKEGEEWKTCFRTRRGNYEYLVMPFGLTNAPASFQTMINHVLREYLDVFVVVYLDDILIFSPTLEIHKEHVHKVLQKLQEAKLLVEPEKSVFHSQRVDYLGFTITPGEIRMDDKKIAAVKDWPRPQNVKDIQSFLGFVNFYRRFLKGYSDKINPLIKLTRKKHHFRMD